MSKSGRPNLGYSNYHWINLDIKRANRPKPNMDCPPEELEPPTPIPSSVILLDPELTEETETETCFMFHSRHNSEEEKEEGPPKNPVHQQKGPEQGPRKDQKRRPN